MRKHLFLMFLCLIWSSAALAQNFDLVSIDASRWPDVEVVAALPDGQINAADYSLKLAPSGRTVTAADIDGPISTDPAHMVVAVDTSRSLTPAHLNAAKKALEQYVDRLNPDEKLALLAFNDNVQLESGFTSDRAEFKNSLKELRLAGNKTELYRTLLYSIDLLKNVPGRHHLLVVTDGHDEGTGVTREEVLKSARENYVKISTVGIPGLSGADEKYMEGLREISAKTGGFHIEAKSANELERGVYGLLDQQRALSQTDSKRLYKIKFNLEGQSPNKAVNADLVRTEGRDLRFVNLYIQPPQASRRLADSGLASPRQTAAADLNETYRHSMGLTDREGLAIGAGPANEAGLAREGFLTDEEMLAASRGLTPNEAAIEQGALRAGAPETTGRIVESPAAEGQAARLSLADNTYQAVSAAPPAGDREVRLWYNPLFWVILIFLIAAGYWLWRRYNNDLRERSSRVATSWVLEIPETGQKMSLPVGKWRVGSAPGNYVVIKSTTVSPNHAEIEVTEAAWTVRDLNSATGTKINGVAANSSGTAVRPGDELMIGRVRALLK